MTDFPVRPPRRPRNVLLLVVSIIVCQAAGGIGSLYVAAAMPEWYPALHKPAFTPPDSVFGPVWSILYLLMGFALYLIAREGIGKKTVQAALLAFALQLACNVLWPVLFFGHEAPFLGLIAIGALLPLVGATIILARRVSRTAAAVLVPYLLWVVFAAVLNFSIWRLNR
jgi:translocator protein